jgi:hypothetical protein
LPLPKMSDAPSLIFIQKLLNAGIKLNIARQNEKNS